MSNSTTSTHPNNATPLQLTTDHIESSNDNSPTLIELKEVNNKEEEQTQQQETNFEDDNDVCSDSDSVYVQVATRKTQRLTLTSIKPQIDKFRIDRAQNSSPIAGNVAGNNLTTVKKPTTESIFTKTTAKTGKSGKSSLSSVTFRIPTCCGMIELNLVRVLSLLGMLLNIGAFIAIAVIVGNAFKLDAKKETNLLLLRTEFLTNYYKIDCIVKTACVTGDIKLVAEYNMLQPNASQQLLELKKNLPAESLKNLKLDFASPQYVGLNNLIMGYIAQGDLDSANSVRKSLSYLIMDGYTNILLNIVRTEIDKLSEEKQDYLRLFGAVNMSMVLFGVAISVPIVLLIFAIALSTDVASKRKLNKATGIMIMEAIASEKYNPIFKTFCEKESCLDYFTLLDNCHDYHELCDRAHDLRYSNHTYGNDHSELNSASSISEDKIHKEQFETIERNKYEVAFKIFSEFIDPNGETPIKTSKILQDRVKNVLDEFNVGSVLDDDLFDELEKQVCEMISEHFIKFKQQIKQKRRQINSKNKIEKVNK